jgi:threonine synthase
MRRPSLYDKFREFLPHTDDPTRGDIGQGFTPLLESRVIGPALGLEHLYFKMESLNPTGSYKDRFAGLAVNWALQARARACIATSSGNTGAALAAVGAAFGLGCNLFVSEHAPAGKLTQMQAYGARLFRVRGLGVDSAESGRISAALRELSVSLGLPFLVSAYKFCPEAMEGIKTIAYEIAADLGVPDDVFIPAGGGGLFASVGRGFADVSVREGREPRMHIVQPRLNDSIVTPLSEGLLVGRSVSTTTRISGLSVARDLDSGRCIEIARRTQGTGVLIEDEEAFEMQRALAQQEGILVEPAGAVSVAGMAVAARAGLLRRGARVVCVLTGHGFKDPSSLAGIAAGAEVEIINRSQLPGVLACCAS